jgi:hypothetical protein
MQVPKFPLRWLKLQSLGYITHVQWDKNSAIFPTLVVATSINSTMWKYKLHINTQCICDLIQRKFLKAVDIHRHIHPNTQHIHLHSLSWYNIDMVCRDWNSTQYKT